MEVPAHLTVGPPSAPMWLSKVADEMRDALNRPGPSKPSLSTSQHAHLIDRCSTADVKAALSPLAEDRELAIALRKRWDEWAQHDPDREIRAEVKAKRKRGLSTRPSTSRKGTATPATGHDDEEEEDEDEEDGGSEDDNDDDDGDDDEAATPRPRGAKKKQASYTKARTKNPNMVRSKINVDASALSDAVGGGRTSSLPWAQRLKNLDHALPSAFRFHENAGLMARHCQRETREAKNAIAMPVDVRHVLTQRPGNADFMSEPAHDEDLLRAALPAALSKKGRRFNPPLILRISVFSRRSLPMNESILHSLNIAVAKEQGAAPARGGLGGSEGDAMRSAGERDQDGGTHDEQDDAGEGLRGDRSTLYGRVSLTQTLEIRSDATLLDLRNAIVCRMDDVPERAREGDDIKEEEDGGEVKAGGMRFTGRKRHTDSALLIENVVYSEEQGEGRYANIIESFLASRPAHERHKVVEGEVMANQLSMNQVRLDQIKDLRTGRPYAFFHQGSCEHLWAIQAVRLPHRTDVRLPLGTAHSLYGFPLTLNVPVGHMQRLVVKSARWASKSDTYGMDRCGACKGAATTLLIVGGERVRLGALREDLQYEEEEEGWDTREEMINGIPQQVLGICANCWEHMTGLPPTLEVGEGEDGAEREGTGAGGGKLNASADASRTTWAEVGGEGWTVVPVLD